LNKKITDKDKQVWEKFVNSTEKIHDKDQKVINKNLPYIEKTIDLHGYTLKDANKEIEKFILLCFDKGVSKINIITGKGSRSKNMENPYMSKDLSILKYSVPNYIKENADLMGKISKIDMEAIENSSLGNFEIFLRKKID
tara:strand:- start:1930 stop:2349 length:420 start_codon:yes stop_codon:yes gene_type:complete